MRRVRSQLLIRCDVFLTDLLGTGSIDLLCIVFGHFAIWPLQEKMVSTC